MPPFPPPGRDSRAWDYLPLPLFKALVASKGYLERRASWEGEHSPHRLLQCHRLRGTNRVEPNLRRRLRGPNRAEPKCQCNHPAELVWGHLSPQPV